MERIASIQRGVPDLEEAPKSPKGEDRPSKPNTAALTDQTSKGSKAVNSRPTRGANVVVAKKNNKTPRQKSPAEVAFLAKKLQAYRRRQEVKEKTKRRALVR